jgi:hypothetical protein
MMEISMNKERSLITVTRSVVLAQMLVCEDLHGEHDEIENHERYETEKSKLKAVRREEA